MTDEKTQQPLGVASDLNAELGVIKKRGKQAMKNPIGKFESNYKPNMKIKFINQKQVTEMTSIPRSTLYYLMSKGLFPKSVHIAAGGKVAWIESEVLKWITDRVKERDSNAA